MLTDADVSPGAHVVTVGPKAAGAQEVPPGPVERASVITCDSPGRAAAYDEPFFVDPDRLVDLADVLLGRAPGRTSQQRTTLHCSVGLAGSEVLTVQRLLARGRA